MNETAEKIFYEIHTNLPREGPGNFESTRKAFSLLTDIPKEPVILDVGCGPGKQTLDLVKLTKGMVYAIDVHQPYLDALIAKVEDGTYTDRLWVKNCDMADLPFEPESFDIIWSEGAIYIIGFEEGLDRWSTLLKPNGYMAVTELTWLDKNPPPELRDFWLEGYPAMKSIEENLEIIKHQGFTPIDHFILPENAWWDDYYSHIEPKLRELKKIYKDDPEALFVLESEQKEIDFYKLYSNYYGYVFYIMKKTGA